MADYAVEAGVDDFLVFLDFDCAGEVGVFSEDFGVKEIGYQEEGCGCPDGPVGKQPPAETPVETGCDKGRGEQQAAKGHDGLLLGFFLPGIQAFLQKARVLGHQDESCNEHRYEQDAHQQPSLPVAE